MSLRPLIFASLLAAGTVAASSAEMHGPEQAQVSVCFSPPAGCVDEIVQAIASAKSTIHMQAFLFDTPKILNALAAAKSRNIDVEVILDKVNDLQHKDHPTYTGAADMQDADIPVWIDYLPHTAHNKIIIIDDHLVVGGSYNYNVNTEEHNAENVTFIDSETVAGWYLDNWNSRKDVSLELKKGDKLEYPEGSDADNEEDAEE